MQGEYAWEITGLRRRSQDGCWSCHTKIQYSVIVRSDIEFAVQTCAQSLLYVSATVEQEWMATT